MIQETDPRMQLTIPTVLRQHLDGLRTQIKSSSYGVYNTLLENHIVPYFAEIKCADLSPTIVQSFVDKQLENGLSSKRTEDVLVFLKKGLEFMFSDNYKAELPKSNARVIEILTMDEQRRLEIVAMHSDSIDHIAITLCLYTGIKLGELCGLMWQDVDFEMHKLHIRRTAQRIKIPDGDFKTTTTFLPVNRSAQRSIPLMQFLAQLLKAYESQSESEYVISKIGNPIDVRNMQRKFARLLQTAGIRPLPFQVIRDTFVARALEKGFDLKSISEVLGHSTLLITVRKYSQLLEMDIYRRMDMEAFVEDFHQKA